ncbi:MAG: hypothetical protein E7225_00845 [Clostridiales bacterium]|nr:hypothetical protein [Clostridiales bacterium]
MDYVLGIDAGGSKYLVKAATLEGKVIGEYITDSSRLYDDESKYMRQYVPEIVYEALEALGLDSDNCKYLVCGSSGVDSPQEQLEFDEAYAKIGLPCPTLVVNDTEIALYAACGGKGVLVIAGTGSIAAGKNSKGESTRTGGWGVDINSDQGSGRDITLRAMLYVSYYLDGIIELEESELVKMIVDEFNVDANWLSNFSGDFRSYPEVVKKVPIMVDRAYEMGDPFAEEIMHRTIGALSWLGTATADKLKLAEEESFKMSLWGSVGLKSPHIYPNVKAVWEKKYPNVEVVYPSCGAADGAVKMALDNLHEGIDHSDKKYKEER